MRFIPKFAALALAVSFVSIGAVQAHHVGYECVEGVDYQMIPLNDADEGPFYLTIDEVLTDNTAFSVWIYWEQNDVSGLQRHDSYCYNAGIDDSNRDEIIF